MSQPRFASTNEKNRQVMPCARSSNGSNTSRNNGGNSSEQTVFESTRFTGKLVVVSAFVFFFTFFIFLAVGTIISIHDTYRYGLLIPVLRVRDAVADTVYFYRQYAAATISGAGICMVAVVYNGWYSNASLNNNPNASGNNEGNSVEQNASQITEFNVDARSIAKLVFSFCISLGVLAAELLIFDMTFHDASHEFRSVVETIYYKCTAIASLGVCLVALAYTDWYLNARSNNSTNGSTNNGGNSSERTPFQSIEFTANLVVVAVFVFFSSFYGFLTIRTIQPIHPVYHMSNDVPVLRPRVKGVEADVGFYFWTQAAITAAGICIVAIVFYGRYSGVQESVKLCSVAAHSTEVRMIDITKLAAKPEDSENSNEGLFLDGMYLIMSKLQINMELSAFFDHEFSRVEEMPPSQCFVYHREKTKDWERFMANSDEVQDILRSFSASQVCETSGMIFMNYQDLAQLETTRVHGATTVKFSNNRKHIFMMLSRDFFIAHHSGNYETYVLVPGSPIIIIQGNEINLEPLLGKVPTYQIYLIARRLYQFTKAKLSYDCFAKLEKELMIKNGLIPWKFDVFNGLKIELPPMLLSSLSSYEIGYFPVHEQNYYNLSIDVLGEIVVLQKRKSEIPNPVILSAEKHGRIQMVPSLTDHFDVAIGGDHPDHEGNRSFEDNGSELDIGCFRIQKGRAHNLAYIPQNDSLSALYDKKYYPESMQDLYESCKVQLKYGEQLSDAIRKCVAEEFFRMLPNVILLLQRHKSYC